jgi:NAD+ synthase
VNNILAKLLTIDCEKVSNAIVDFIRKKVTEDKRDGVALGLSGGIDSTVSAILAARAVGPSNVYALHLFDRQSHKKFREYAQKMAIMLGINLEMRDITASVRALGAYKPLIMRMPPSASLVSIKLISPLARLIRYFWIKQKRTQNASGTYVSKAPRGDIRRSFNVRHIERRRILEEFATEKNLLLIGAANRSESFVGWFVKDGVDDIPIEVILGLYKTQVRQLAHFLEVPTEIIKEAPSPDMLRGITDESAIGYSYETIDKVAYIIEHGLSEETALREDINQKDFEHLRRLNQLTAWKRTNTHEFPVF